jgi:hypothetical protein
VSLSRAGAIIRTRIEETDMKHRAFVAGVALLATVASCAPVLAYTPPNKVADPNWPCQQILVSHLSPAAMWSGPSIQGLDKSTADPDLDALATKIAQRRLPIEQAKTEIEAFAKSAGADRKQKLTMLFALVFSKLDDERGQVLQGLVRFGQRQKEMADKIRAESDKLHETQDKSMSPEEANDPNNQLSAAAKQLQWDLRIFNERHSSLTYVCESPVLIEQRLFALAREIQAQLPTQ